MGKHPACVDQIREERLNAMINPIYFIQVASHENNVSPAHKLYTDSRTTSPMHSPPLTPAATHDQLQPRSIRSLEIRDKLSATGSHTGDPAAMTPQQSPPRSDNIASKEEKSLHLPSLGSHPVSVLNNAPTISPQPNRKKPSFQIGPVESIPSNEGSPVGTPTNRSPTHS